VAAEVGEMFYVGGVPWHGEGKRLEKPATIGEAVHSGGLDWEVGEVDLQTAEIPPSAADRRKAIVRLDRPPGHPQRVLGVVHRDFQPLQNVDGAKLFDGIFGKGRPVYHTGGYLRAGDTVWLLAKLDRVLKVGGDDPVETYALFANSHDGSISIRIRLTTVRVVCQNTLALALNEGILAPHLRRAHQGSVSAHAAAAGDFWRSTVRSMDGLQSEFIRLSERSCDDVRFQKLLDDLLPIPRKSFKADDDRRSRAAFERRVAEIEAARKEIRRLRVEGIGMELLTARGTYWGALNAVLEYVDHVKKVKGSRTAYTLLGDGMELKARAFHVVRQAIKDAA
jgi:phage/plasmid-like protein (TIGR03299 family)